MKLTPKQQRFVDEYLVDLNATQAAIRAGYSKNNAGKIGFQLIEKTRIQAALKEAQAALSQRTQITQDRVLQELAKLGFSDVTDYLDVRTERVLAGRDPETGELVSEIQQIVLLKDTDKIPKDKLSAIAEIKQAKDGNISFKLHDKKGALELIGRHLSMFTDNLNHQAQVNVQFNIPRPPKGPVVLPEEGEEGGVV